MLSRASDGRVYWSWSGCQILMVEEVGASRPVWCCYSPLTRLAKRQCLSCQMEPKDHEQAALLGEFCGAASSRWGGMAIDLGHGALHRTLVALTLLPWLYIGSSPLKPLL